MDTWESNGHVTDDVTWPWNVKVVTLIHLEDSISKTAGDRGFVPKDHQCVGDHQSPMRDHSTRLWRVEWSRARWRHVSSLLIRNWLRIVTSLSESIKLLGNIEKQQI